MKLAVLFLNEENQRGHWGFRWTDPTGYESLLKEGVELLVFIACERVDLTVLRGGPWHQLDGMIPLSGDDHSHFPKPRFSAIAPHGPDDPALPDPLGSVQHVRGLPVLWPESGVGGWRQWSRGQ